jgi:hypothetical protein
LPQCRNGGVFLIPSLGKGSHFPPGFFFCGGTVNGLKILRHLLAFFPAYIVQTGPHQMHDAQLHLRLGKHRLDSLREAFQPVNTGDEAEAAVE